MKLGVIVSAVVFGMSLAAQSSAAPGDVQVRSNDPWCNPSYCPPTPGGPGSGSTTGSDPGPQNYKFIELDCRQPLQERYAKVLEWYLSLPIGERLWWYQIGIDSWPAGTPVTLQVVYHVGANNHGDEYWEIVDPYSSVPIAPTPLNSDGVCFLLNGP